jgi:hypothetical protein
MFGSNPDSPYIKFPPKFCLGRLINDSCPVPAGLSAVIYKINPLVSMSLTKPSKNDVRHTILCEFRLFHHLLLSSQNPCDLTSFMDDPRAMARAKRFYLRRSILIICLFLFQCGVATCDRLVEDTYTIDLNMYSRDNQVSL